MFINSDVTTCELGILQTLLLHERKKNMGLKRWLSGYEHLLIIQRTQVQLPAPLLDASRLIIPVSRGLTAFSGFWAHLVHILTSRHTDINIIKNYF